MRRSSYLEVPLFDNLTQRKASCPNVIGCNSYMTVSLLIKAQSSVSELNESKPTIKRPVPERSKQSEAEHLSPNHEA